MSLLKPAGGTEGLCAKIQSAHSLHIGALHCSQHTVED